MTTRSVITLEAVAAQTRRQIARRWFDYFEKMFNRCASGTRLTAVQLAPEDIAQLCKEVISQAENLRELDRAAVSKLRQARQAVGYGRSSSNHRQNKYDDLRAINAQIDAAKKALHLDLCKLVGQHDVPGDLTSMVRDAEVYMLKMLYLDAREEYLRAIAVEELSSQVASTQKQEWMRLAGVPDNYHFRHVWHYVQKGKRGQIVHLFFGGEDNPVGKGHGHFKLTLTAKGPEVTVDRLPKKATS